MDSKVEDKIVRQIEKNLSNNINENLFLSGRVYEKENPLQKNTVFDRPNTEENYAGLHQSNSAASLEYDSQFSPLPRAEYIRQAREACLQQFGSLKDNSRAYDSYLVDQIDLNAEGSNRKKTRAMRLFQEDSYANQPYKEMDSQQEIAAFRFLIIRTVCAIVLFLSIFILDKFDLKIGALTPQLIQEYVTGNDTLQTLENILVTWLH